MDRFGSTPFPQALQLPLSLARAYLESEAVKKAGEADAARAELAVQLATRIDNVTRAVVSLQTLVAKAASAKR